MQRFRWQIRLLLGLGAGIGLLIFLVLFRLVDDWKRDFRMNYAETAPSAPKPSLRPIDSALAPVQLSDLVIATAKQLPRWEYRGQSSMDSKIELKFVRSTPIFRFRDDITVLITGNAGGSRLTATSRSRIGKGDLGQNPRNLIELLDAVRQALLQHATKSNRPSRKLQPENRLLE